MPWTAAALSRTPNFGFSTLWTTDEAIWLTSGPHGPVPESLVYKTAYISPVQEKGLRSDPKKKKPVYPAAVTPTVLKKPISTATVRIAEFQHLYLCRAVRIPEP